MFIENVLVMHYASEASELASSWKSLFMFSASGTKQEQMSLLCGRINLLL
jgi:hypothetical protein